MAKKTKDSNLSIEERLEQALIPNWDEPYKLPPNWCWTKFDIVAKWGSGGTPSRKNPEYYVGNIPWVKTGELNNSFIYETEEHISEKAVSNSSAKLFPINTVIIAMYGATIGKVGILGLEATTNQACACGVCSSAIDYKYLFYYSISQKDDFISKGKGGAQPNISQEIIKQHEIPLPPFAEQQRIVARIESLFAKLDEAKEKAQEVVDGFETRKAAILHKAFSGELTAKWREENGVSFDEWNNKLFDECIEKMQNGLAKRGGSTGTPYVVLRLANLSDDGFITDDLRHIVLDEKEQKTYKLNVDDVIMIRVNGSKDNVAKQILVTENNPWAFCDHIIRIKYNESVLPEYMVLYSKSEAYKIYVKDNIVSSAGQNTISRKGMARLSIPVPTIDEQKEISNILLDMFEKERRVKETAEAVIEQIDTMKKAILARAFRGELGTNDPSEESAVELLKKVLGGDIAIQTPAKKPTKRISIPSDIKELLSNIREEEIIKLLLKSAPQSVSIQEIMSLSSKKFELMDALRSLEKKQLITKNESGEYSLTR